MPTGFRVVHYTLHAIQCGTQFKRQKKGKFTLAVSPSCEKQQTFLHLCKSTVNTMQSGRQMCKGKCVSSKGEHEMALGFEKL